MGRGLRGVPFQFIGGIETQREARVGSGVTFQFLVPSSLPASSSSSPAPCLKGSCVASTGVPPSFAKMPLGLSAGTIRSEDGSEVFLEGMGNSYVLYFTHSFPWFSQVPGLVLKGLGNREAFQETPLVGGGGAHVREWK